jgi:hypothetical protein
MTELKDWLNSINSNKKNLIIEDPLTEKAYLPFIVNKCLSYFPETVFHANQMNLMSYLDKRMQYEYFLNKIPKKSRFSKWHKAEESQKVENIKEYYGYSTQKAKQISHLITDEQEKIISAALQKGGQKSIKHK